MTKILKKFGWWSAVLGLALSTVILPTGAAAQDRDQQDQQDQPSYGKGHHSRVYLIVPRSGVVTVTCGDGFDVTGQPKQPKNVSEEIGIQRRDDVTIENVKKSYHACDRGIPKRSQSTRRTDNNDYLK